MGMQDITTEIQYGVAIGVSRDQIKQAKFDIIAQKKERAAESLGRAIGEKKKWQSNPDGDMFTSTLRVYVFTPTELRDYVEAKMKLKLIEMSQREGTSEELAEQLRILSERV